MDHIKFPSINQFRQIVKSVRDSANWNNKPVPTITFECTKKVHGSNGSWIRPVDGTANDIVFQSRERICTIESDNAGFALWSHGKRQLISKIMDDICRVTGHTTGNVQIYGEWFGGNIQKGVGVTGLPKMFMIFGIRVSDDAESTKWEQKSVYEQVFDKMFYAADNIYTKYDFGVEYVEVDFNKPEFAQNKFVEMTDKVEHDCPVARWFKPDAEVGSLIGEGIVITPIQTEDIGFDVTSHIAKIKGEKHAVSKVKTTNAVDPERIASIHEFAEKTATQNRLQQGLDKMNELGVPVLPVSTGVYIQWVVRDILREEADTMAESGFEAKDVTGPIANIARKFWMENISVY